jgi:hypothetical protein
MGGTYASSNYKGGPAYGGKKDGKSEGADRLVID